MYIGKQYYPQDTVYQTIDQKQRERIHTAALRLLAEHGMLVQHPVALKLLEEAGAMVGEDGMVLLPPAMVEKALRTAPSHFTVYDRNGDPAMYLGGRNVYYGTGSDTLQLLDYESGQYRPWTKAMVEDAVRVADAMENIDFLMSMGLISDVEFAVNTREQYAALLRNSTKPHLVVCDTREDLEDVFRMYIAVRGSAWELRRKPLAVIYNEPTSPLVNSFNALDKLLLCGEYGVPTNYATGAISGGTTPVTVAGTLVLSTAECLFGLTLLQTYRPGAPFVFGFGDSPLDLRTVQAAYAHPLGMRVQGGMCDMARFYDLPCWGEAGHGCSKLCDAQAVQEGMFTIEIAALQGCNITHDLGYNNFGLGYSLESLAINDQAVSMVKELFKGVEEDEASLSLEEIMQVGCNGDFLRCKQTRAGARTMWRGQLSDYRSADVWRADGAKSMEQRAHERIQKLLAEHHPQPLTSQVDQAIESILEAARKNAAAEQ